MLDYKLILILVLSIVLFYLYNKVEKIRYDINKIKVEYKKNTKVENYIPVINKKVFNTVNSNIDCEKGICKIPEKNNINKNINLKNINLNDNDIDTTEFPATEDDTLTDDIIIYSNDKESKINTQNSNDELSSNSNSEKLLNDNKTNNEDIIKIDHTNLENNNIFMEANFQVEKLIDQLVSKPVIIETLNYDDEPIPDLIPANISFLEENENKLVSVDSDLDYDNIDTKNIDDNIDMEILDNVNKYKLYQLQDLAKEKNIEVTKSINGKIKNKTKKELYTELSNV